MTTRSTPSPDITIMSLVLELGELRYRVAQLELRNTTSPISGQNRATWALHQLERAARMGPTVVHFLIWLTPKLIMGLTLLAAYLNGTIAAVLRFLLAHL